MIVYIFLRLFFLYRAFISFKISRLLRPEERILIHTCIYCVFKMSKVSVLCFTGQNVRLLGVNSKTQTIKKLITQNKDV